PVKTAEPAAQARERRSTLARAAGSQRNSIESHHHFGANSSRLAKRVRLVGPLPCEVGKLPAKVPMAGGFPIDRPAKVERLDNPARRQFELIANQIDEFGLGESFPNCSSGIDPDG